MSMPKQKPGKSKQDYQTPPEFLLVVRKLLNISCFSRDLAASGENTVNKLWYFTEADDALSKSWQGKDGWQWLNPPYSNIKPWVEKAAIESVQGANIAMLIPASVGSNWWRDYVHNQAQVLLLNGRITFVGCKAPYPKDCALLLYRRYVVGGYSVWNWQAGLTNNP